MVGKWWDLGTTINVAVVVYSFSHVWPFVTPWTIAPPGSSVHGISQAIILDWVVISFPRGSPWPRDGTRVSCTARRILYHCATGKHTLIYSSVQLLSRVRLFVTPWITECQTSLSITISWSSRNSRASNWWCHPAISSSVIPFSSCPQSLPISGSFPMSQLFAWGGL